MPITLNGDGAISGLTATGISAVQNLPAGSVLQVVQGVYNTEISTTSTTLADTGLTVSITPKFATSKILVIAIHGDAAATSNANGYNLVLLRSGSQIGARFAQNQMYGLIAGAGFNIGSSQTICYLDSPATTSSTTYKTQWSSEAGGGVVLFRDQSQGTITAMEIAA
jgi:hypothetical protein